MPFLSNYLAANIAKAHFAGSFQVGAFTTAPSNYMPGVEVDGGSYARVDAVIDADRERATNDAEVIFGVATRPWGDVVAMGVFEPGADGKLLWFVSLDAPEAIGINHQLRIPRGALRLDLNR